MVTLMRVREMHTFIALPIKKRQSTLMQDLTAAQSAVPLERPKLLRYRFKYEQRATTRHHVGPDQGAIEHRKAWRDIYASIISAA